MNSKQNNKNTNNTSSNKIISNSQKNNLKKLSNSNSKNNIINQTNNNINSKDNPNDTSVIIKSNQIDIDNIDISSYNSEPYIIPKKKFEHNFYITKIETAVNNYNKIKENLTKKILDNKIPKKSHSIQLKNFALLEDLNQLSSILDTLVDKKLNVPKKNQNNDNNNKVLKNQNKKIVKNQNNNKIIKNQNNNKKINNQNKNESKQDEKNKPPPTKLEINKKLLESFMKQYNLLSEKYNKISKDDYIQNLKNEKESYALEITQIEQDNKKLKKNQIKNEGKLKKGGSFNDSEYKDKLDTCQRLENEYNSIVRKIGPLEERIKYYGDKINKLNKNKEELIQKAKDKYNMDNPEKIDKKFENEEHSNYWKKKELELINKKNKTKVQQYEYQKKENGKYIKQLIDDKMTASTLLKEKNELLKQLNIKFNNLELENINLDTNQIIQKNNKNNDNNNNALSKNKNNENENNENENNTNENNSNEKTPIQNQCFISPIKPNEKNSYEKINTDNSKTNNNRYDNTAKTNNQTFNKKEVLENLRIQSDLENKPKLDKTLNLKKNLRSKPNLSYNFDGITNTNSNLKNKKMNYSVVFQSNTKKNIDENEIEGEIKEDIQYNSNIVDDKKEEEQNFVNLSQNISLEKNNENDENQKRENDFNTVLYETDKKEENKFTNNNEKENDYENDFLLEDNQNINMN